MENQKKHCERRIKTRGIEHALHWIVLYQILLLGVLSGRSSALSESSLRRPMPPLDPCRAIANTRTTLDANDSAGACPEFHPNFLGGQVCRRCYRDDYEILAWETFSSLEKGYALEDAASRARNSLTMDSSLMTLGEASSLLVEELEEQSELWTNLAKAEKALETETAPPRVAIDIPFGLDLDRDQDFMGNTEAISSRPLVFIPSAVSITNASKDSNNASTDVFVRMEDNLFNTRGPNSTGLTMEDTSTLPREEKDTSSLGPPPPTPCTRICRYNTNCYDGKVCIGCFRETHEIARWSSMSPLEKQCSLEDAADRFLELGDGDSVEADESSELPFGFEGGISETELRRQAHVWGVWGRRDKK